jgi:hypothetical protein
MLDQSLVKERIRWRKHVHALVNVDNLKFLAFGDAIALDNALDQHILKKHLTL